jgi:WD40 repeat protein
MVFDPVGMIVTSADGATVSQWSYTKQTLNRRENWKITALEVNPLVRRVIVDRKGVVQRTGLTLNISHGRLADLRIKVIAPSGRTVELETGLERASSDEDIRIAAEQLTELVGEPLEGTWTISVRDESPGVAGQLVGWNLKLNSQGIVEEFQRGLNIPEPVERETDNIWFDAGGRYAVARATQSDSARIWDLAFAEPVRAIAVSESEELIGLDPGARRLITATQDLVNVWDTASGDRVASIPIRSPSDGVKLTADGKSLFVELRSDEETRLEMWSLEAREMQAEVIVAGVPSLVAIDPTGKRVAAADYDRAIRIWDFATGELQGQVDLPAQPSAIRLAAGGDTLGVVYGNSGIALWQIGSPMRPLHEEFSTGEWQLVFSPSGNSVLVGEPNTGYQMYATGDGRPVGPLLGLQDDPLVGGLLAYGMDEKVLLTGNSDGLLRFWKASSPPTASAVDANAEAPLWSPSAGNPVAVLAGAKRIAIGNEAGHVHIVAAGATADDIQALSGDVSFVGHLVPVRRLAASDNGALVASVAADNSLRVWDTDSGQPLPYAAQIDGPPVVRIVFSPDASKLGVLTDDSVRLLSTADGAVIARFKLAEPHAAIAFAADGELYLGDASGTLRLLETDVNGDWKLRQLWQGAAGIRWLEASPRGKYLVLVDENNLASQFVLGEGQISSGTLALPGDVQDVAFNGSRVLFRTSRWVHRASVSIAGLGALDSAFVPKTLNGARMQATANGTYLATASAGFIELVELGFDGAPGPMLFGNRDELLSEWRLRLLGIAALLPQ